MGQNVVILTGAGISAESGVKTFRDDGGLWENHRIEDVATPEGFMKNPSLVHDFYNARRSQCKTVNPNPAHLALAEMEAAWKGGSFLLVTQNVDDLHERAGSGRNEGTFIHMHGELNKARCVTSGEVFKWTDDISTSTPCPCCSIKGGLRPHIVWFGEMPFYMDTIYEKLRNADIFIAIGTSGNVYPAAGFVYEAKAAGVQAIEINLEPSEVNNLFDEKIYGPAGKTVPELVKRLLQG